MRIAIIPALLATLIACGDPAATPASTKATPADVEATPEPEAEPTKAAEGHEGHGADEVGAFTPITGEGKRVFFVEPADGATVTSPVKVVFGVEGLEVIAAGTPKPDAGHHHVIIDGEPTPQGEAVAKDDTHIHYGGGQTEAELTLEPGEHTLTMQFADFAHRSYGADLSATIKVTVTE